MKNARVPVEYFGRIFAACIENENRQVILVIKNILVPVDGSETSDKAVAEAIKLAEIYGARLNFLYVANINQVAINAALAHAIMDAVRKAGRTILNRAADSVPKNISHEEILETGAPAVMILNYEESLDADLIVMGSRGLSFVKGVLLGSVSQYIIERANCPVLVVK